MVSRDCSTSMGENSHTLLPGAKQQARFGSPWDDENSWFAAITLLRCPTLAIPLPRSSLNYEILQRD